MHGNQAQPAAAAPCHCRPILHRHSYTAPRLRTAPQPARHLVAKGGRSIPCLQLEPSAPAVKRAGGSPPHTAQCPTPLPRSAPRWHCSSSGLACSRQGRAEGEGTALPLSLPHLPSSTATSVLSRSQFFLRKPRQPHPFLPAFTMVVAVIGSPGLGRAVRSRTALLRAYSGEAETGRSPGNSGVRPAARPRSAHAASRPLPCLPCRPPPVRLGCGVVSPLCCPVRSAFLPA